MTSKIFPLIISGFPGVGKTFFANMVNKENDGGRLVIDHDSTPFSWINNENGERVRNPSFPSNYVDAIHYLRKTSARVITVSSHIDVRLELERQEIPYILLYPEDTEIMKLEFMRRYKARGNDDAFLELVSKNWSSWIQSCADNSQTGFGCRVLYNPSDNLFNVIIREGANFLGAEATAKVNRDNWLKSEDGKTAVRNAVQAEHDRISARSVDADLIKGEREKMTLEVSKAKIRAVIQKDNRLDEKMKKAKRGIDQILDSNIGRMAMAKHSKESKQRGKR